jgi:diacylglycerol kinase (ATP)
VSGCFWNYFSVGLDAEAAYGFHRLREEKPWAASSRLANQAWYSFFSCTSGERLPTKMLVL